MLTRIRKWSKDRTQTTLPVSWRGKGAHGDKPHMSLKGLRTIVQSGETNLAALLLNYNFQGTLLVIPYQQAFL